MYHVGVPNFSKDSDAFDPDISCRWLMLKNHDFVGGSRQYIIVVRISNHETEIITKGHRQTKLFFRNRDSKKLQQRNTNMKKNLINPTKVR